MHPVLANIIDYKKSILSQYERGQKREIGKPLNLIRSFDKGGANIIAEIKFASPKEGRIAEKSSPSQLAMDYINAGAKAISVLTEGEFFEGSLYYIKEIKDLYPGIPVLMKDFILEKNQIELGYAMGADGVLLIAALHKLDKLSELYDYALELGMTPLIEVHNREDLEKTLRLNPSLIGINNRNLKTMEVNLDHSRHLVSQIPDDVAVISESGLSQGRELNELVGLGFSGFLIGSHFMKQEHPAKALEKLLEDCHAN